MRKYVNIISIVLVGILIGQTNDELFQQGVEAYNNKSYSRAEELFQQILSNDDTFAAAHVYYAKLMFRKGNMDDTQKHLLSAISTDPNNQEYRDEFDRLKEINTLMGDGARLMSNGRFDEAYESYRVVLEKVPFYSEAAYSLGLAKFRLKDFETAVLHFQEALTINPDHDNARAALTNVAKKTFNEGNTSYKRGNLEEAIDSYRKVLTIDVNFYQAYYQIGVIETKMQNITGAIESYVKAIEINPNFYKGWFALGIAYNKNSDADNALVSFEKAVEVHPGYAKAYAEIGKIYVERKEFDQAEEVLKMATQVDPSYAKPFELLGMIYAEKEILDEAARYFELSVSLKPKNATAWYRLAQIYNQLSDCENAIRAAREATDRKKSFGGGWVELGIAEWCGGKGNKTAALNAFEKARNDRSWRKMAEYEIDKVKNPQKYQD